MLTLQAFFPSPSEPPDLKVESRGEWHSPLLSCMSLLLSCMVVKKFFHRDCLLPPTLLPPKCKYSNELDITPSRDVPTLLLRVSVGFSETLR